MLRGIATINFWADDLNEAIQWYSEFIGTEPYFVRPTDGPAQYVEWRIGDYQQELGFIDRKFAPPIAAKEPGGAIVHWHVDDLQGTLDRLVALGATIYLPIIEHGPGFVTASVIDPFGNIFGIMHNKHYLDVLDKKHPA